MDDLLRDRIVELSERFNDLSSRLAKLEQDSLEANHALILVLTRLKHLEDRHRLKLIRKRR